MSAPHFPLGQVVATPGALNATSSTFELLALLGRHARGDWGCVDPEDAETNRLAVIEGDRPSSTPNRRFLSFRVRGFNKINDLRVPA